MPRRRRHHVPGGLYHAVLRGNHRQAIFSGDEDYRCFEDILGLALDRYGAVLFAYCWMTNHVHLAIRVAEAPLGAVMGIVASRYARAKQRPLATTGHLFERRYRARLVDADRYLLALVRYIHLNPVRANIVSNPRDYRWSSHRAYLGAPCPGWLHPRPVLSLFGGSADEAVAAYQRLMDEAPDDAERAAVTATTLPGRARRGRARRGQPNPPEQIMATRSQESPLSLDAIATAVAIERGLAMDELRSKRRHPSLVQARVEIARRALQGGVASLSQVARHLGRAPSTLSGLLLGRR